MTTNQIATREYDEFSRYLEEASGIVLGDNRHQLVTSRLSRLMREFEIADFPQLMIKLRAQNKSKLHQQVVDTMTNNDSLWFQDNDHFETLKHELLPQLSASQGAQPRIWSAACASGQETYSISIATQEYLDSHPGSLPDGVEIVGTDISATLLGDATEATYDSLSLARGISAERREKFFQPRSDSWQVRPEITSRTDFSEINLLEDFSHLGKFDIIFCRNVLIYFARELKSDILNRMAQSLNPGGYLILGLSESPKHYTDAFEPVPTPVGEIYRVRP